MLTEFVLEKIAGHNQNMNFHSLHMGIPGSTKRMKAEMPADRQYAVEHRELLHNITVPIAGALTGAGAGAAVGRLIANKYSPGVDSRFAAAVGGGVGLVPGTVLGTIAAHFMNRHYTKKRYQEGDTTAYPVPHP